MYFDRSSEKHQSILSKNSPSSQSPVFQQQNQFSDPDPFNIVIVEDLLQGVNDWRNIQEIVRLTFKALTDIVKNQGEVILQVEKQVSNKASKQELNSFLNKKLNNEDFLKELHEINQKIDSKANFDLTSQFIKEQEKNNLNEINQKLDEFQVSLFNKFSNDQQQITQLLSQKADMNEMMEILETKANKQTVANALHRKVNRTDIDQLLNKKIDKQDQINLQSQIQQLEFKLNKNESSQVLKKILQDLDCKIDKSDLNQMVNQNKQISQNEFEKFNNMMNQFRCEVEDKNEEICKQNNIFSQELEQIQYNLHKKAENKELESIFISVAQQIENNQNIKNQFEDMKNIFIEEIQVLKQNILDQQKKDEIKKNQKKQNDKILLSFREDISRIDEVLKQIEGERINDLEENTKLVKNISNSIKNELVKEVERLSSEVEELRNFIVELVKQSVVKDEYDEFKSQIQNTLEEKVDLMEVQSALNTSQTEISKRFVEFKEDLKTIQKNMENEILQVLNKKATLNDVSQVLNGYISIQQLQPIINQVNEKKQQIEDLQKQLDKLMKLNGQKVEYSEFQTQAKFHESRLEDIKNEIQNKANTSDIVQLVESKTNQQDLARILNNFSKELQLKANKDDINNFIQDQGIINESLCTENILGRWTWKSGDLKTGSLVPWEIQVVNTLPDNFLWDKDKTSIIISGPGLYEITGAFYARRRPQIQILVNQEAILTSHESLNQSKFKEHKHSAGSLTGMSILDFIVLPARARISVVYNGEAGGEGFICLKRL